VWVVVALVGVPTWLWILLGIGTVAPLQGIVLVNLRVRKLRNVPPGG
jgi:hypothetical protein